MPSAAAIFWRSFSSASSFRLSRSRAASSKRSASASSRMRRVSEVESSVVRPSRKSRAASEVSRYSSTEQIESTQGATQRRIWYWRQGRGRFPLSCSRQFRMPKSRCTRLMLRRARLAGK